MYGDTEVVRKHADRLREQASEIRALADRLVARTEAVPWAGRAASDLRERVRERAARLREAAERHDLAAETLDDHAQQVDDLKEVIAHTERRAGALLDDGTLPDFEAPRPGHKDWLSVSLPGVSDRG